MACRYTGLLTSQDSVSITLLLDLNFVFSFLIMAENAVDLNNPPETIIIEKYVDSKTDLVIQKRYTKGRLLGKGGFAKVYEFRKVEHPEESPIAGKVVPK